MMEPSLEKETFEEFQRRVLDDATPRYFDKEGKPLKLLEWARLCDDHDYKILKQDEIGIYFVSTVWIGMNLSMFRQFPMKIFETMIFVRDEHEDKKKDNALHLYQERYSTVQEALNGHEVAMCLCRGSITLEELNKRLEDEYGLLPE